MKFLTFLIILTIALASARPTLDVIAGVLHELADEFMRPTYEQTPQRQPYPCQQNGYNNCGYTQHNSPPGAYPNHYNTVNRPYGYDYRPTGPAAGSRPYYENGYDGPYTGHGFQSPQFTQGTSIDALEFQPGYGYQQPAYPYPTREHNAYPNQRY